MTKSSSVGLWHYFRGATLPPLLLDSVVSPIPPPGHRRKQCHEADPGSGQYGLRYVRPIAANTLEEEVASWFARCADSRPFPFDDGINMDMVTRDVDLAFRNKEKIKETASIPCPGFPGIPVQHLSRKADFASFTTWLSSLPLTTAQYFLHGLFYGTLGWSFHVFKKNHYCRNLCNFFVWTRNEEDGCNMMQSASNSLLVAFQPPWVLTEQDMEDFAKSRNLDAQQSPEFQSQNPIWVQLWGQCFARGCRWFILTTYDQWIFGRFSTDWTTAFCSSVYQYDSDEPTILQMLIFWVASAMELELPLGICSGLKTMVSTSPRLEPPIECKPNRLGLYNLPCAPFMEDGPIFISQNQSMVFVDEWDSFQPQEDQEPELVEITSLPSPSGSVSPPSSPEPSYQKTAEPLYQKTVEPSYQESAQCAVQ